MRASPTQIDVLEIFAHPAIQFTGTRPSAHRATIARVLDEGRSVAAVAAMHALHDGGFLLTWHGWEGLTVSWPRNRPLRHDA